MRHKVSWQAGITALQQALACIEASGMAGADMDAALGQWRQWALDIGKTDRTLFLVGNGASASMASHFAADLCKNAGVRAQVFTDLSQITAIANDFSFEEVYSAPLSRYAREGDMLVAISSSGASPNILAAVHAAKEKKVSVVTLSAFKEDNPLRALGDINFYVPVHTYGLAETSHAALLHFWMDALVLP